MSTAIQTNKVIKEIASLINSGIESWIEAGKLIVEEIDKDYDFRDRLCDQIPNMTYEIINRFEQIGRNRIYPYLLVADGPGIQRLRSLPYDIQEKHYHEPVNLVVEDNGKVEILKTDVRNLTTLQAKQVFSREGIRSEAAQRAWIKDMELKKTPKEVHWDQPYRIVGNKVVFHPCTITRKDLARILAEMG